MKKFLLVFSAACVFAAAAAFADNYSILRALSQLQAGGKGPAAQAMEAIYNDARTLKEDRIGVAKTLAFLEARYLKVHKRQDYAAYVLKNAQDLSAAERSSLLRIAGDGCFQAAQLDQAERFYLGLAKSQDSLDIDYAQYKLGWIDLNRNRQDQAFLRWRERIVIDGGGRGRQQHLRQSFIHDLGRAWAETEPVNVAQTQLVQKLAFTAAEKTQFVDGILAGLRRRPHIPPFRAELLKTEYASAVFNGVLQRGMGLTLLPCAILEWIGQPDALAELQVAPSVLLPRLNNCYKYIQSGAGWESQPRSRLLLAVYATLDLRGLDRLPRSGLYKDMGQTALYCQEFTALEKENFAATQKPLANALLGEAMNTCGSPTRAAGHDERQTFIGYVLANPGHFKNTPLPLLLAGSLSAQERPALGAAFLAQFAPQPLQLSDPNASVWIELLRQALTVKINSHAFNDAAALLQTYVPLERAGRDRSLELWTLLAASAQPAEPAQNKMARQIIQTQLGALPPNASAEQSVDLLALANRFDMAGAVWMNWRKFNKQALEKTALAADFFQRTYIDVVDGRFSGEAGAAAALEAAPAGRAILAAARITKSNLDAVKKIRLPGSEQPKFLADLHAILSLRDDAEEIEKLKLRFDTRLAGKIESGARLIKKQMSALEGRQWSHPKLLLLARLTILDTCTALSDKIQNIPQPKGITSEQAAQWKTQFSSIIATIADWKKSI